MFINPVFVPIWGQQFHFDTDPSDKDFRIEVSKAYLRNAISAQNKANALSSIPENDIIKANLEKQADFFLGRGLHALQDSFAHVKPYVYRIGPWYSHLFRPGADKQWDLVPKVRAATIDYLDEFLQNTIQCTIVTKRDR
jgi:hypothetical protein